MKYGYMGKLLCVNLTQGKISERELTQETARKYLGGSGLGARYLFDETEKATEPFGEDNLLMFLTGPFVGTPVCCSGRHAVVTKSPHGIWGEADSGGSWGEALKKSGYDGVLVRGKSEKPVYIWINDGAAQIRDASHLWGRDTYDTDDMIKKETAKNAVIASIGLAGEKLSRIAVILCDGKHARVTGRGGLGSVMGSKKLKAIAVYGEMKPEISDREKLIEVMKGLAKRIKTQTKRLSVYGTAGAVIPAYTIGDLPIKNWTMGKWEKSKIENISGERMAEKIFTKKYYCKKCIIGCGRVIKVSEGPYSGINSSGPEYETLGALGSLCLIDDLNAIAMGNELCNRYGIDTISTGSAIAFGMEAYEKGIITKADTDGIELKWGDSGVMIEMVHKIGKREGLGKIFGEGLKIAAKQIGGGAMDIALEVKGLEPPMHDPRSLASLALSYATYPRGACHRGSTHNLERSCIPELGYDKPLERQTDEGKGVSTAVMQDYAGLFNSLKMCSIIINIIKPSELLKCLNCVTGWDMDITELLEAGERAFNLKRMYNVRLGMTRKEDTLPVRLLTEKFEQGGASGYLPNLEKMLNEYYEHRGWSKDGIPLPSKLKELGLMKEAEIVKKMYPNLCD
jgi:aldehyde:ferredoxin oxidoreductase